MSLSACFTAFAYNISDAQDARWSAYKHMVKTAVNMWDARMVDSRYVNSEPEEGFASSVEFVVKVMFPDGSTCWLYGDGEGVVDVNDFLELMDEDERKG